MIRETEPKEEKEMKTQEAEQKIQKKVEAEDLVHGEEKKD